MSEANERAFKTKYVHLEMILNKDTKYDVLSGLFKGIIKKDGETFILLHGLKNSTNVLNTKFYNIMTIEELEDDYKNMTYLTAEKADQTAGFDIIKTLYERLITADFVLRNDRKIIDISKYKDVPKEHIEGTSITNTETNSNTKGHGSYNQASNRYTGSGYLKTTVKKEPEPLVFGRKKNKKPNKDAIESMIEKLDKIRAGTYEEVLPETLGEDSAGTGDADDDHLGGYCYGGIGY